MLRHQIIVLRRQMRGRVRVTNLDRFFLVQLYRWFPLILRVLAIVQPETVFRWHRAGFRSYWRWKSRSRGGRPAREAGESLSNDRGSKLQHYFKNIGVRSFIQTGAPALSTRLPCKKLADFTLFARKGTTSPMGISADGTLVSNPSPSASLFRKYLEGFDYFRCSRLSPNSRAAQCAATAFSAALGCNAA